MIYLPDTNVFSRFLRERDVALRDRLLSDLEFCRISPICLFELEYGAAKRSDVPIFRTRVERLRELILPAPTFGGDAAYQSGQIRAYLERLKPNAQPIGPYDVLLAGHAISLGAVLVTQNTREFSRIPGLTIEDWSS